jgi:hypothetical protein
VIWSGIMARTVRSAADTADSADAASTASGVTTVPFDAIARTHRAGDG